MLWATQPNQFPWQHLPHCQTVSCSAMASWLRKRHWRSAPLGARRRERDRKRERQCIGHLVPCSRKRSPRHVAFTAFCAVKATWRSSQSDPKKEMLNMISEAYIRIAI